MRPPPANGSAPTARGPITPARTTASLRSCSIACSAATASAGGTIAATPAVTKSARAVEPRGAVGAEVVEQVLAARRSGSVRATRRGRTAARRASEWAVMRGSR